MKRCLLLVPLSALLFLGGVLAQERMIQRDDLDKTQKSILDEKSKISETALRKDRLVIRDVYPKVVDKYGKKVSEKDIQASLLFQWRKKRVGKNALDETESLERESFEKLMLNQGVLRIKSTPSAARVFIDGEPFSRTTETVVLISLGRHKVKATKGDTEAEEECVVGEEDVAEVNLTLK